MEINCVEFIQPLTCYIVHCVQFPQPLQAKPCGKDTVIVEAANGVGYKSLPIVSGQGAKSGS